MASQVFLTEREDILTECQVIVRELTNAYLEECKLNNKQIYPENHENWQTILVDATLLHDQLGNLIGRLKDINDYS